MSDTPNIVVGTVWGTAMFVSWSVVLYYRVEAYRRYTDNRSIFGVAAAALLWATSIAFALTLAVSVLIDTSEIGITLRGLLWGLGLGAFTGAGVLEARRAAGSPG